MAKTARALNPKLKLGPKMKIPRDLKRLRCVRWQSKLKPCSSTNTWAVYQHVHENGAYTFEMPAFSTGPDKVPYNMPCPHDGEQVWALYVRCGDCGYIGRVDIAGKKVLHYPEEEQQNEGA